MLARRLELLAGVRLRQQEGAVVPWHACGSQHCQEYWSYLGTQCSLPQMPNTTVGTAISNQFRRPTRQLSIRRLTRAGESFLRQVERMAKQLGVAEGEVYTCETAAYFWLLHVLSRWEKFLADVRARRTPSCLQDLFPFKVRACFPCNALPTGHSES